MNWVTTIVELQNRVVWVKLLVVSCLAMTIGLYLFCSLVYPNHLVCLYHFDHSVPSDLAVTSASQWTLGIALCQFSCTVMVPYKWVRIMGSCLLSSNLHQSMTSWSKECGFHSSLLCCAQSLSIQEDVD